MENIMWRIHGLELKALKPSARQLKQKFIFKYWACNEREAKLYQHLDPHCKTCVHNIRTDDHILHCKEVSQRETWKEMLDKLKEFF